MAHDPQRERRHVGAAPAAFRYAGRAGFPCLAYSSGIVSPQRR